MSNTSKTPVVHPVIRAANTVGSQVLLAKLIGVTKQTVQNWKNGSSQIPEDKCIEIEKCTSGAVRCEDLNSRADWQYIRSTAKASNE